jgi:membrane protease subunit HflK
VLSGVDKTIIEAPGVTPFLPLPEVSKRATNNAQAKAAEGGNQ